MPSPWLVSWPWLNGFHRHKFLIGKFYISGVHEMVLKVIEWGVVTWRHMHKILRLLNFKFAKNLDHMSKLPSTFQELRHCYPYLNSTRRWKSFGSFKNSEVLQNLGIKSESHQSEPSKMAHLWVLICDPDFEPICLAISKSHAYAFPWQHLLRWLLEPSQGPSRKITLKTGRLSNSEWKVYVPPQFFSLCVLNWGWPEAIKIWIRSSP